MVKIGKIPARIKPIVAAYDPYALIELTFAGQPMFARPFEFDSEPSGQDFLDQFGKQVTPLTYAATCPACGHLILLDTRVLNWKSKISCEQCKTGILKQLPDPFRNPIEDKLMVLSEPPVKVDDVDDVGKFVKSDKFETAADRLKARKSKRSKND